MVFLTGRVFGMTLLSVKPSRASSSLTAASGSRTWFQRKRTLPVHPVWPRSLRDRNVPGSGPWAGNWRQDMQALEMPQNSLVLLISNQAIFRVCRPAGQEPRSPLTMLPPACARTTGRKTHSHRASRAATAWGAHVPAPRDSVTGQRQCHPEGHGPLAHLGTLFSNCLLGSAGAPLICGDPCQDPPEDAENRQF